MRLVFIGLRFKPIPWYLPILIGLTSAFALGCTSSDVATEWPAAPEQISTLQPVEVTQPPPAVTGEAINQQTGKAGLDADSAVKCPVRSGPAVAINKWSPNRGSGLNEVWVIPIAVDGLSLLKDVQDNPVSFAPGSDPNADTRSGIQTYSVDAPLACNLTQEGTANEFVVGVRPGSNEILVYRANEVLGELVLSDLGSDLTRIVADFAEQFSIEEAAGKAKSPLFGQQGVPFPEFSPDGSALAHIEPCWQAPRYQEALGTTGLLKKRCQDGGYLVITDLESMDSHVIHGSENNAAIVDEFSWSPDGSSILISQRCSELSGVFLPEDPVREEEGACNGIWTVPAALESDHFEPREDNPIHRFFDCEGWDGSIVDDVIWSPGGGSITVSTLAECKRGIWEIEIASGEFERIVECPFNSRYLEGPEPCGSMRWSPSGDRLLFIADDEGFGEPAVWVSDNDGGELRRISPWGFELANDQDVQWTHDGEWIAFHSFWANHTPSLWMVNVGDPTRIIAVPDSGSGIRDHQFAWLD